MQNGRSARCLPAALSSQDAQSSSAYFFAPFVPESVIRQGVLTIFELLSEGMDDHAVVSRWLVKSIDYIDDSVRGLDDHF